MEFLLVLLIILLEVVAIVDVLRSYLSGAKKILWIILILMVPVLGLFLYFLLGRPDSKQSA